MKLELETKLRQSKTGDHPDQKSIRESTENLMKTNFISDDRFFEFEFLVVLNRSNLTQLNTDLKLANQALNTLAYFRVETFGAGSSFLATLPGNHQHVTLKETAKTLSLLFPLYHFGETKLRSDSQIKSNLLPLHRKDHSIFNFDLFSQDKNVFNSLIIGTSGKGKSVLTGLLTQSLLNDPNVEIIKVDVGGSHSKECELLGGREYIVQLSLPTGINPFEILNYPEICDSEKISILSRFLIVLIQEEIETFTTKELRSNVEASLASYLTEFSEPTLQDFYNKQKNFPRKNLLSRWVHGGVFQNVFAKNLNSTQENCKLKYYNFSQVFQASDPEFTKALIAAVLTEFNRSTLLNINKRIVLICDETPFFIKSCFDFFKFTTANVRKFGHAVILISQLSTDLIVNGDTGIIENSPTRFLFSSDGELEAFKARFNLSDQDMKTLLNLKSIPGIKSDVILQENGIAKQLQILITKNEYWQLTSTKSDNVKLEKLRGAVPELSLDEAIKCLSAI